MLSKEEETRKIFDVIGQSKRALRTSYGVKRIGLFGSYVTSQQGKRSDVDLLVEFDRDIDLFDFIEVKEFLERLLERKVDLVMKSALKPRIKRHVLEEVKYA